MSSPGPVRALVVGESLVDIVRDDGGEVTHPGGSPLNVAVGLARLGIPTLLHTSFGADSHGSLIAQRLEDSAVALTPESVNTEPTSIAEATIGVDGAASYRFAVEWDPADIVIDPPPSIVHTGSISALLEPGAAVVERIVRDLREVSTVSYDPNVRPQLMGSPDFARRRVESHVANADVVKASDEDLAWLYPDRSPDEVLARWLASGPALVVVTRGEDGADAIAASGRVHVDAPTTNVADTIGAGDSFTAGLLAVLADRNLLGGDRQGALRAIASSTVVEVVTFAARCAAFTVSREGANPPTRAELEGI
ncbi:MAG TPA: carbohydrate kinase [Pseudolysinimonas sp.]|nr:carbohydrate kinase [Pseudolysinimonas sp.]